MSEYLQGVVPSARALATGLELHSPDKAVGMAEIAVTGDLCPMGRTEDLFLSRQPMTIWGGIIADLQSCDLRISNLECPLTNCLSPIAKHGPVLSASPACAEQIRAGGFDVLTLANNHIMDMGQPGLVDTLEACNAAGLKTVGAGCNLKEACRPLLVEIKRMRIAILAFAEHEFNIASEDAAGACPLDIIDNYRQIQEAKAQADFVLIALHGGNEYYPLPRPGLVKTCRFFVDSGANVVVCHHSHVPAGVEVYQNAPIFYGTGNLLFDYPEKRPSAWYTGYLVRMSIQPQTVTSFRLVPYFQFGDTPGIRRMPREHADIFLREIARLSSIVADSQQLEREWQAFCRGKEHEYMSGLLSRHKIEGRLFRLFPFLRKSWLTQSRVNLILNLVRCESHQEVLIEILSQQQRDVQ